MRRTAASSVPTPAADDEPPARRAAVQEVARLGWLYGSLNQLAPLARLLAIVSYLRGAIEHPQLLVILAPVVASLISYMRSGRP